VETSLLWGRGGASPKLGWGVNLVASGSATSKGTTVSGAKRSWVREEFLFQKKSVLVQPYQVWS